MLTLKNRKRQTELNGTALPDILAKREKKQTRSIVEKAKRGNGIPCTAQQPIPLQGMFPGGICRVSDCYYTKAIQFQDINYQLAQQEDKASIFEEWCGFLNFFDSSTHFGLSSMNMTTDMENFERQIQIQPRRDGFDDIRQEYSQMLR